MEPISWLIFVLSLLSLVRIAIFLIASDVYELKNHFRKRSETKKRRYMPSISIIIPAHNEEQGVIRGLVSVLENTYQNKEVLVVDDGSTDNTLKILRNFKRRTSYKNLKIIHQKNSGKAAAVNNGIKQSSGALVMVLDADSILEPNAVANMVSHFRDRRLIAAASNVKIMPSKKLLGLVQQVEYIISYYSKRALTTTNIEYIIGGVGSTFRRSKLVKAGLYDTDTITEDIDLTMKLINRFGNRKWRIGYAADCVASTEHVLRFKSLIKQRYRWKYGRFQVFIKHRSLFFSTNKKHGRLLSYWYLPYAIFGELALLLEPLMIGVVVGVSLFTQDFASLLSVYLLVTSYILLVVLSETTESIKQRLKLAATIPFMYMLLYILTVVEFAALVKSVRNSRSLFSNKPQEGKWEHVERLGVAPLLTK